MTEQPPTPPPQQRPDGSGGWVANLIESAKGLTFSNVIIIILLIVALVPAYVAYRVLNDEQLLFRFLSSYREIPNPIPGSNCTLREVSVRGGGDQYSIGTSFASLGADRWQLGVLVSHQLSAEEIASYCETLNIIIDYMRDPVKVPPPTYPGTNEPLIWPYPLAGR